MLRLSDVSKSYRAGPARIAALHGVSLAVETGAFAAVCGPSGSGKSTLLNLIGLLDRPDTGSIHLAGQPVDSASRAEAARLRNRRIGFVFQSFQLLARLTAWQNVALPLLHRGVPRAERRERALAMLDRLGLAGRAGHRPSELSGGQCQRVALARALIGAPGLVLADEPTGNLDSATAAGAMDLLAEINREMGVTLIMVTHDRALAARCGRVIDIKDGRVAGDTGAS